MKKMLLLIVAILVVVGGVVLVRAAGFRSKQVRVTPVASIRVDAALANQHLAQAVTFRTVSYLDPAQFDPKPMRGLQAFLEQAYPQVHATLSREAVGDYSLLYTWKGSDASLAPIVLMAHMDVVPVEPGTEARWSYPPFGGRIADGYIWGRGAMDDKSSLIGVLEGVETLLRQGWQPRRTIYLAFGHDEEVGGTAGGRKIATLLESRGVHPEYVLDEGGFLAQGLVLGIRSPVALVAIAEKGYASVELTAEGQGGHSSAPPPQTTIGILSAAIENLETHPLPARIAEPLREMFEYLGPEMPFAQRAVFANLWLFSGLVERMLARSPASNAMIRTSTAATIFQAGVKDNVLPSRARAVINFRILPGDTIQSVIEHVRTTIRDPRVKISVVGFHTEASPTSDVGTASFQLLERTIREVFPGVVVAPYCVMGGTDARYYTGLTKSVFRFDPLPAGAEDLGRIHGTNERVSAEGFAQAVRFFYQLLRNTAS